MNRSLQLCLGALIASSELSPIRAQQPVINPNGIVNAASMAPDPLLGTVLVPQRLSTILGQNLSVESLSADGFPLPTVLAGTSVLVDGVPAPLVSVAPTSITFQARGHQIAVLPDLSYVTIEVSTPTGMSNSLVLPFVSDAAGLFTQGGSGCGQGLIYNVDASGVQTLNTPANSASPGDLVSIRGTGFWDNTWSFHSAGPPDGVPPDVQYYPENYAGLGGSVILGLTGRDRLTLSDTRIPVTVWNRLLAEQVGIDEDRAQIPLDAPEGCAIPLKVFGGQTTITQPVFISIHKGGGQCQDQTPDRVGSIQLTKIVVNPAIAAPTITETLSASFIEAPANLLVAPPEYPVLTHPFNPRPALGPSCPGAAGQGLDGGALTIQDASGDSILIPVSTYLGTPTYLNATLPLGTIRPGTLQLSGAGGPDFGTFQAPLTFPRDITILEHFKPGDKINVTNPTPSEAVAVHWIGGTSDINVTLTFLSSTGYDVLSLTVPGDIGAAGFTPGRAPFAYQGIGAFSGLGLTVKVTPANPPTVQIPGIAQPVKMDWTIVYKFTGLVGT